jgi:hypothetical protein
VLAAIAGVGLAVWQGYEFFKGGGVQGLKNEWQGFRYGESKFGDEDTLAASKSIQRNLDAGMVDDVAKALAYQQERIDVTKEKLHLQFGEDAKSHYEAAGVTAREAMVNQFRKGFADMGQIAYVESISNQEEFLKVYNQAVNNNDQALANYIANFAAKNVLVGSELRKNADLLAGGFDAFIARLGEKTAALVDTIDVMSLPLASEAVAGKGATINMNGGQNFNIKQDFREADPDRIALFFRRDLVRAATSRTRARVRTPFGA